MGSLIVHSDTFTVTDLTIYFNRFFSGCPKKCQWLGHSGHSIKTVSMLKTCGATSSQLLVQKQPWTPNHLVLAQYCLVATQLLYPAMNILYFCSSLVIMLILPFSSPLQAIADKQAQFFTLMKTALSGEALSDWRVQGDGSYCNYTGITCDYQGHVTEMNLSGLKLKGSFPPNVCSYLPELRMLVIGSNYLQGSFPYGINNCSVLEELDMSYLHLGGVLPDFSGMKSLRAMDLSFNRFTGDFPVSVTNLINLEVLNLNENDHLDFWELPENITQLKRLTTLVLSTTNIQGLIIPAIGNMTTLTDLELSGNYLQRRIPVELGMLKNLRSLMLYYNQLSGTIPEELGNLTELTELDMSVNQLTGKIPDSICRLPRLNTLQLYNNSLVGEIPAALGNSNTLSYLSVYQNFLTGGFPQDLGNSSTMIILDMSENYFSGKLPPNTCRGGKLLKFLALSNRFTGEIPESYANCTSLIRFRVSANQLVGMVPEGIFGLPHANVIDLAYNQLTGTITRAIANAKNTTDLLLGHNKLSGVLPPEISGAVNLVKLDLSNNFLFGSIPKSLGDLKNLNLLLLQHNNFTSPIPKTLSQLKSLNALDLSNNQLTGTVPESLSALLPHTINLSYNHLYGPIPLQLLKAGFEESFLGNPGLCITVYTYPSDRNFSLCQQSQQSKGILWICITIASVITMAVAAVLLLLFCHRKKK